MAVQIIHLNFMIRNTYDDCIIEFQLQGNSCEAVSEALVLGGFAGLWNMAHDDDRSHRFILLTKNFASHGVYPITKTSEMVSDHKILKQELSWSIATYGIIEDNDKGLVPESDYEGAMRLLALHFGQKVDVQDILTLLVEKEIQALVRINQN